MPRITIRNAETSIETSAVTSILNALQQNAVAIKSVCGGKARCGRCAIRIRQGSEHLSARGQQEITRLEAIGADQDIRLACQTYTYRDVEIEIVNPF